MGWNRVRQVRDHPLWQGIEDGTRFYFVHSYYVDVSKTGGWLPVPWITVFTADAALARDNLFATQFHPEKSHTAGLQLLKNFLDWDGQC